MTKEMIIEELRNRGYEAKELDISKNGVKMDGIAVKTSDDTSAVFYLQALISYAKKNNMPFSAIVDAIIEQADCGHVSRFKEKLTDKEYVLNNIFVGLQSCADPDILMKPTEYGNIMSYLYVRDDESNKDENYTAKVRDGFLDSLGISEDEAWKRALSNTKADTVLVSMTEFMREAGCIVEDPSTLPLFILTNKSRHFGAAALLNKEKLAAFGQEQATNKFIVLPSSIHEVLIIPYRNGDPDPSFFSNIIPIINQNEVKPEEWLSDHAYIVEV